MSARWPSSLLNSTNQRLTESIEQLSAELESKRNTVAELREVVGLLKRDHRQTRRQEKNISEALASKREEVEKDEGKLKQLTHEVDGNARRVGQLKAEEARLGSAVAALEDTMEHRRHKLEEQQKTAAALEEEVKAIVLAHLARQRTGEDLSAAQNELSSAVWGKLERLNERANTAAQQLADARTEHHHVLRELDVVQQQLQEAVKEQYDSVHALELVHAQTSQLDAHVMTNATSMETLKQAMHEKKELRDEMRLSLDRCLADNTQRAVARDRHRSRYDQQLHALRQLVESIRGGEAHLAGCKGRRHAEEHFLHQQRRELDHIVNLCEEKTSLLEVAKARHTALVEARALLDKQLEFDTPSSAALRNLILSLSRQKDLLEDRLERAQVRLAEAIQLFVQEGRKGDQVNEVLAEKQKNWKALSESQDTTEREVHLLKQRCAQLEDVLSEQRALLPSMQTLAQEQRAQRQESRLRDIEQLRAALLRSRREHQQLLQGVTTLRSSLYRSRKSLENGDVSQSTIIEELRLLDGEVAALEQEQRTTTEAQRSAAAQFEQANVTLQSLMKAADVQVGVLKEAAGVESFLRAEVQIKEEQIQAEMQGRLVELHLHENELHELNEELQRHSKKLGLLRLRYDEVMASLARASQKPLNEEQSDASLSLPSLKPVAASSNPETVHAHLLLRRSFEREQLMQRGNYLDLRLVALDRETSTLRHMLDGLRASSSSTSDAASRIDGAAASKAVTYPTEKTKQRGVMAVENENASPVPTAKSSCSPATMKDELVNSALSKEHYWKMELDLLDEAVAAMTHERDRTRTQLNELRSTLKELQNTEKQRRMRLQKLRELWERSQKSANAAAMKGIR
ncbi:hypothetical protein ABB37_00303 [Leptomonas pyrrhocoris]|uniref:Uncharacterized protein n=1 Tax=Leptomonas pyrrhocoris TaxID=157538 RepID=A0A0M9GAG8_LEPPY|nr:hypothetical protein ABB37_00303 [Leptomonas pyrrhocoris]XP_015664465.1 hypothetical protein ABB37_00303 [Leptomonas pyrrhocoris]KPA86025.1 hypothetical protein ABB37_00303 [Leptomonas pyrrhocoris]KPA86026.1 hypothetical protein ABB37_00303 [Leptomonas pyrrhocoris]|eukprot:XP_015664464.1 hypothetical protein ABB37_00303 [Leptomonas pyrrhocoris]